MPRPGQSSNFGLAAQPKTKKLRKSGKLAISVAPSLLFNSNLVLTLTSLRLYETVFVFCYSELFRSKNQVSKATDPDETANQRRQGRFTSPGKIIRESGQIFRDFGSDRFDRSQDDDRKNVDGQITDPEAHYRRPVTLN